MPRNGSGTFTLAQPAFVNGNVADATAVNSDLSDIASEITNSLAKDGQTTPTANIPMGGNKLTGLGAATLATDAVQLSQLQNSTGTQLGTIAGTNTITAQATPTLTAYATGQEFDFIASGTNTGATTINIDTVGAKNVYWNNAALVGGEITNAIKTKVRYDGTQFNILAKSGGVQNLVKSANIASAATTDLSTATGNEVHITGSTGPITSFGTVPAGTRFNLIFDSTPTLTYNASSMILNTGSANYIASAGDRAEAISEGAGNWIVNISPVSGFQGRLLGAIYYSVVTQTVAMTIASPCVVTAASSSSLPMTGSPIVFTTSGALPTGIVSGTTYWVINASVSTFNIATTKGGTAINTSGSQSGTHTANNPSYVKATGVNGIPSFIIIEVWGGGGGGGGSSSSGDGAGGGGAGGYSKQVLLSSVLTSSETITVGAGGTSGANSGGTGGTGNTSSFGAHCSATGGLGGVGQTGTSASVLGGAGGSGSGGDINLTGTCGGIGSVAGAGAAVTFSGFGGNSSLGGNGLPWIGNAAHPGNNATPNSGSGGGGAHGIATTAEIGGVGGSGLIIISEYQ